MSEHSPKIDAWNLLLDTRQQIKDLKQFQGQTQIVEALTRVLRLEVWRQSYFSYVRATMDTRRKQHNERG